jgi:hypothetical protein
VLGLDQVQVCEYKSNKTYILLLTAGYAINKVSEQVLAAAQNGL